MAKDEKRLSVTTALLIDPTSLIFALAATELIAKFTARTPAALCLCDDRS
jgi:hypothetical protein